MDVRSYNREAWDRQVAKRDRWTIPVTSEAVAAARRGEWDVVLTPERPVPRAWFPALQGAEVLALASGGGQQGPLLAAAGAKVTVFDNSPAQLRQDRAVADRDGLTLVTLEGDMRDLSRFPGEPLVFGHTLEEQIGGQLEAGFLITGFYEDRDESRLAQKLPLFIATRAVKPSSVNRR